MENINFNSMTWDKFKEVITNQNIKTNNKDIIKMQKNIIEIAELAYNTGFAYGIDLTNKQYNLIYK